MAELIQIKTRERSNHLQIHIDEARTSVLSTGNPMNGSIQGIIIYIAFTHCTHIRGLRYVSTHIRGLRYVSTHIHGLRYVSTHIRGSRYVSTHIRGLRYVSTHIRGLRYVSTHIRGLRYVNAESISIHIYVPLWLSFQMLCF